MRELATTDPRTFGADTCMLTEAQAGGHGFMFHTPGLLSVPAPLYHKIYSIAFLSPSELLSYCLVACGVISLRSVPTDLPLTVIVYLSTVTFTGMPFLLLVVNSRPEWVAFLRH